MGCETEVHSFSDMTGTVPPVGITGARASADLVKDLGRALENHQLVMYLQPIVDVRTLAMIGAEAQCRWHHPRWGGILVDDFMPLARNPRLIKSIWAWMMKEAICQLKLWALRYGSDFRLSMTLSARQLRFDHRKKIAALEQMLLRHGLQGKNLMIEITGHSLQDNTAKTQRILKAYRAAGVRVSVALDGSGNVYPLLFCLERNAVDLLKIDRSLVQPLVAHSRAHHRCSDILQIARKMSLAVVADGVETVAQAKILEDLGCDLLQGDLFGRPMPANVPGLDLGPYQQDRCSLA